MSQPTLPALPRAFLIASLVLGSTIAGICEEMRSPRVLAARPDWSALAADLEALAPGAAPQETGSGEPVDFRISLRALNNQVREQFAGISASPVPVLLPFDTAAFLRGRSVALPPSQQTNAIARYLFGFNSVPFFHAGPTGYDAVIVARASEIRDLGIWYPNPIYVHVSGFSFLYDIPEPVGISELPVRELDEFADMHHVIIEEASRYSFVRYGVAYVISIECSDGRWRYGKPSCREADKVAVRALKSLRVAGGMPEESAPAIPSNTIDRPAAESPGFAYHSPGDLIAGTGFRNKGGVADYTVFSAMRFPLAQAPAFANSQSFLNSGDCEAAGRSGLGVRDGIASYRCRVNGDALVSNEGAGQNYSYPWRDNFCEMRHFQVGQCPAGLGHQGQDIRPAFCRQRNPGDPCEPGIHDVVAVHDGVILRTQGQPSVQLVVNAAGVRARFRYLHMSPRHLDADGLLSGRFLHAGQIIGKVANFLGARPGTTSHLHFDLQVPTRYGWVFVNPYMTLVSAYERLIQARGREFKPTLPLDAAIDPMIASARASAVRSTPADTARRSTGADADTGP